MKPARVHLSVTVHDEHALARAVEILARAQAGLFLDDVHEPVLSIWDSEDENDA